MKKLMLLVLICVVLCGCDSSNQTDTDGWEKYPIEETLPTSGCPSNAPVIMFVDPDTGVEYLVYRNSYGGAGMCPRYMPDGSLKYNSNYE